LWFVTSLYDVAGDLTSYTGANGGNTFTQSNLLQLRTDLLAPRPEVGLDQQTTKITYSEVRFADLATPLWLPHDVNVYIRFTDLSEALQYGNQGDVVDLGPHVTDQTFRNMHRYSNYQRYRVSTKILQSH
jgi:hypothetical protein